MNQRFISHSSMHKLYLTCLNRIPYLEQAEEAPFHGSHSLLLVRIFGGEGLYGNVWPIRT
jgi:hypothetical protein